MHHAALFGEQRGEKMQRQHLAVIVLLGLLLGTNDGFLGFDGEFIESHEESSIRSQCEG